MRINSLYVNRTDIYVSWLCRYRSSMAISYMSDLRRSIGSFMNPELIGTGAYGTVFRAFDGVNNRYIAMKRVRLNPDSSGAPATLLREISLLKKLKSDHIIELKDVVLVPPTWCYMIFEFADTDLRKVLTAGNVTPDSAKRILRELLQGLEFCHSRRVIHRDLKPENILMTDSGCVKIADFGLARLFQIPLQPLSGEVQTLHYRAPEVLLGCREYTPAVDMWSAGCIFAELLTGRRLFEGINELHQMLEIARIMGPPPQELNGMVQGSSFLSGLQAFPRVPLSEVIRSEGEAVDLLSKMLDYDPCQRISAAAALQHAYFAN